MVRFDDIGVLDWFGVVRVAVVGIITVKSMCS